MGEVKLFWTWTSPYAQRIVWALKLKGIEYETMFEDLANKSRLLLEYNPVHKKVPVLLHDGAPICESLVILEYVDDKWNTTARLLPDDPLARATTRFWAKFCDDQVLASVFQAFVTQGVEQEKATAHTIEKLDIVEKQLTGDKFFSGETIGFLDLVFGWIAVYLEVVEETSGIKILDKERFPLISAWKERFSHVPVIEETLPDRETLISKYQRMRSYFLSKASAKK
ncbi:putative glutathione transferase [Helianthus annuus]|nr:putative glutathione transferase [Helianthus annuus]KAJ0948505.1 putative glutathione transferase [Helianthus annuus]KAJ0957373.1 putative glutathione transferase [Helianthus annuus]